MRYIHFINRQEISVVFLCITMVVLLLLMNACTQSTDPTSPGLDHATVEFATSEVQPGTIISPQPKSSLKSNECPALDSQLYQLTQTDDPAGIAGQLGLKVKENKVQVLLTLSNENTAFLVDFNAEVGTQSGSQVQAYVPFDQLCLLANWDTVLAVRPAAQAIQ